MGLIYNQLASFGLLNEMNDWKSHFTNGTKGMPKTDEPILNYVENILRRSFDNDENKVKNNPLAPWLVMTIKNIGPEHITTAVLNQIKSVIEYAKKTGNVSNLKAHRNPDATYNVTPLDQASAYAQEKLDKIKKKEQAGNITNGDAQPDQGEKFAINPDEKIDDVAPPDEIPIIEAEQKGYIQRVWTTNDGSHRMWVKVIDNNWLTKSCGASHAKDRNWGVMCQGTGVGDKFRNGSHTNYQFIGPAKNSKLKEYSTIVGMSIKNSTKLIAELRQEGNVNPGSQKTSGGWDDADVQTINFLAYSPNMKSDVKGFGQYSGELPSGVPGDNENGAAVFLKYLAEKKPELLNELADVREDIVETNRALLEKLLGMDWFEERKLNIEELAKNKPVDFIQRIEYLIKKFGKQAIDLLNKIDIEAIAKKYPDVILNNLGSLIGNIASERFNNLIKDLDPEKYITQNTEGFKLLIKNMANFPEYKNVFKNLIYEHTQTIIKSFGGGGKGIFEFLKFTSSPRLRQHQTATLDPITGEYIGERDIIVNPEAGWQNRIVQKQKFAVPDNLKVLSQKERRDFIIKNEEYIKSLIKTEDPKGKQINYLRFLFSESNPQDVERTLTTEKDEFVNYYNSKFRSGDVKKIKLPNGQIVEKPFLPGVFEFYSALNKKKSNYIITTDNADINVKTKRWGDREQRGDTELNTKTISYYPIKLSEAEINKNDIVKYYYGIREKMHKSKDTGQVDAHNVIAQKQQKDEAIKNEAKVRFLTARDYLFTLKVSGAKDEEILKECLENFTPEKLRLDTKNTIHLFLQNIKYLLSDESAIKAIQDLKPYLDTLGTAGQNAFHAIMESMKVEAYLVQPGEKVRFEGFNSDNKRKDTSTNYGAINLIHGLLYKVLDTRSTDGVINSEVLIVDNGRPEEPERRGQEAVAAQAPQERWLGTYFFDVKKVKILPTEIPGNQPDNLNEVRQLIRKRISMVREKIEKKKRISYTGVVLDNRSKDRLAIFIKEMKKAKRILIPDDWEFSADHLTINMGTAIYPEMLGEQVFMKVLSFAYDDNTIAVGVNPEIDIEFEKENPHITIAYNAPGGARPVMSNNLKTWKPVPKAFVISGIVTEVMQDV